jgi:ATP/ADP translocase
LNRQNCHLSFRNWTTNKSHTAVCCKIYLTIQELRSKSPISETRASMWVILTVFWIFKIKEMFKICSKFAQKFLGNIWKDF